MKYEPQADSRIRGECHRSPLFSFGFCDHLPAAVEPAFRAGPMGQLGGSAVRADGKGRKSEGVVRPPFSLP